MIPCPAHPRTRLQQPRPPPSLTPARAAGQLLNELGADYDEVRYMRPPVPEGMEDWDRAKAAGTVSGLLPFSQVPALTHKWDGWTWPGPEPGYTEFSMVQSQAIMMYLARLYGLYGVDWHHAANIDVMIGGVEDLKAKWKARFYGKDKTAEDIAAALPLWLADVQPWLGHLEKLKSRHGGKWM